MLFPTQNIDNDVYAIIFPTAAGVVRGGGWWGINRPAASEV